MKAKDIAALLDEPACAHNRKSKSGCARPVPGATAGGCAFDGAQIALLPIADVAHIVHGSIACAGSSWDNRGARSSGPALYKIGMTTDLTEQDVIMGRGEKRLFHSIKQAIDSYHPAAVFVYNTCVPALMGDDIESVCLAAEKRWQVPVVPVDAAGFYGSKNLGNRIAGETMVKYVVGTREPDPLPEIAATHDYKIHDVNLVGEYNIAGEFWHVLPLLDELGLRVLCTLSGDARYREVQTMHRAEVNMMVCSKAMINVARKLQQAFATPWFEGSFYGVADVSQALRDFAHHIGDPDLSQRTETLIAREETRIHNLLEPWRKRLRGRRVLLYTGGVKSWSVISALQDLGMHVVATGTKKSTEEDKMRIRQLMGDDVRMLDDGNPRALLDLVREQNVDILIAGGRNMYTALKAKLPFLDINQEREFGYAGYEGMLELARQMALTLESPVWQAARQSAPWNRVTRVADSSVQNLKLDGVTSISKRKKALSVNPLKSSQSMGAALAFLGIQKAIPMLHGSQGCTAFGKIFFVRHFREPIPLQTSAMEQVSTIMGADDNIIEGLKIICEKSVPELIGLPTTGLSETQGCDVPMAIQQFRKKYPQYASVPVVPVSTPDYSGCMETGFAAATQALIESLVPDRSASRSTSRRQQVNVIVGSFMTPGDIESLKDIIELFGLRPVVIPDLSDSLDGHLSDQDFSPLTIGGTPVLELAHLSESITSIVIGASMYKAADALHRKTGLADYRFDHLMGLDATDALIKALSDISGKSIPRKLERQREQLQDAMLDTHFMLGMAKVAIALDPDLLNSFSQLLAGMGAELVAAIAPNNAAILKQVKAIEVKLGDLEELEIRARNKGAQIVISNSHGLELSKRLGLPLLRAGFPQYDQLGGYQRSWIAYQGSRQTLFELANMLLENPPGEIHSYHSVYSQKLNSEEACC